MVACLRRCMLGSHALAGQRCWEAVEEKSSLVKAELSASVMSMLGSHALAGQDWCGQHAHRGEVVSARRNCQRQWCRCRAPMPSRRTRLVWAARSSRRRRRCSKQKPTCMLSQDKTVAGSAQLLVLEEKSSAEARVTLGVRVVDASLCRLLRGARSNLRRSRTGSKEKNRSRAVAGQGRCWQRAAHRGEVFRRGRVSSVDPRLDHGSLQETAIAGSSQVMEEKSSEPEAGPEFSASDACWARIPRRTPPLLGARSSRRRSFQCRRQGRSSRRLRCFQHHDAWYVGHIKLQPGQECGEHPGESVCR